MILGRATLAGNGWAQRGAMKVRQTLLETLRGSERRELDRQSTCAPEAV